MNEVENQLSELIKKAMEVAEKTGEFVIDQAPLLLQEFYTWHILQRVVFMCIGVLIFILLNSLSNFFGKKEPYSYEYKKYGEEHNVKYELHAGRYFNPREDWQIGRYVFRYLALIIPSIIILINLYWITFIIAAPKLYLIEYFIK